MNKTFIYAATLISFFTKPKERPLALERHLAAATLVTYIMDFTVQFTVE